MRSARRLLPLFLALCVSAAPPLATPGAAQQVLPVDPPPAPYEEQLLRLSEILGAIHYLRYLCEHDEKATWREQMAALLDAENPDEPRRARMIDRFNRGHEGFRAVYRTCTPAAATSADRYLEEGAKIAADITARYGK
jgi:uncharacterized protein (TIGR02301 family)